MMDKDKTRIHAKELHSILEHEDTPHRRKQVTRVLQQTREHWDVWQQEFSDRPDLVQYFKEELGKNSGPRMLID